MKELIFVFAIFCMCFAGMVNAKEVCKYKEGDLFATEYETTIEKATGNLANGLWCAYVDTIYVEVPLDWLPLFVQKR